MTELLRIIAFILLAIGIALVALAIYLYIKKDIKKIKQELKSTRKVAAEKEYDNTLTNNIYYKSEAETVRSKELITQPKGFRRQQERPARNDTGLLRVISDNDDKAVEKREDRPAEKPMIKGAERPAESSIGKTPDTKHQTAPLQKTNTDHNTALLDQDKMKSSPKEEKTPSTPGKGTGRFTLPLE